MSEWVEYSLEDVAEITSSKRIFYADYVDYGIPFYRSKEIIELYNRSEISNSLYISEQKYLEIKEKYGVPVIGDILLTSVGTLGIPYLVNNSNEFYFKDGNLTWIRKINKNIVLPDFIYCLLNSPLGKNKLDEITIGSTQAALTIAGLKKIKISVPNLSEQLEIVNVIQSISKKIELLHRQNKTLESMAETLFRQWFVEEAEDDWEEVKVSHFVTLNKSSITKKYDHQSILYLDTSSLTKGYISELKPLILSEAPSRAKRLVQHLDILISTVRPDQCHYGFCFKPETNLVVSTGFCTITCDTITPYFIYYLLTSEDMTQYLHSIAEGSTSTYPSLKPEDIGNVSFALPPKDKLNDYHNIVGAMWNKINQNQKQIQNLEKLRDTLLPKLMSGEVRVNYRPEEIKQ